IFFLQSEDGIRDGHVTGVQSCSLPISAPAPAKAVERQRLLADVRAWLAQGQALARGLLAGAPDARPGPRDLEELARTAGELLQRSEERRVGKEGRCRGWPK